MARGRDSRNLCPSSSSLNAPWPFGVVGDGEVGHRIGIRLVGAAQFHVARHDGGRDEARLRVEPQDGWTARRFVKTVSL